MPENAGLDRFVKLPMLPDLKQTAKFSQWANSYSLSDRPSVEEVLKRLGELEELYDDNIQKVLDYLREEQFAVSAAFDEAIRGINERTEEVSFSFFLDNVGANLTNQALSNGMSDRGHCAGQYGSVTSITVTSNAARTAGTLTVEPIITDKDDGIVTAIGLTAVLNATDTRTATARQDPGTDNFDAGDLVGCRLTTVSWAPTTADVDVSVNVRFTGRNR